MISTIEYLTIPYVPYGRTTEGVDCWGLLYLLYKDKFNIELPRYDGVNWENGAEVAACIQIESEKLQWTEVMEEDRQAGDIVVMRIKGLPWHIGMLTSRNDFVHADPVCGVCNEKLKSIHWKSRILGYHRLKTS